MANALVIPAWDPLQYCSPEELSRLDERFDSALRDISCLVFWTGVPPKLAKQWAEQHGLPTLTLAMGPLYSDCGAGSVRYGKPSELWSKYMKGASGRFAEYACRDDRRAVVLTNPPPRIYSTRKRSNYRDVEEPILKGLVGGPGTTLVEYVHPTVMGAATFQYQIWLLNLSGAWDAFFRSIRPQECSDHEIFEIVVTDQVFEEADKARGALLQVQHVARSQENKLRVHERQKKAELIQQAAQEKQRAERKLAELEQHKARVQKNAIRKKVEMDRQRAQVKEKAKRMRVELEQQIIQEKKEANRKRVELEQWIARQKKEFNLKRMKLERKIAQDKKDAKRKRKELEQHVAQDKKDAKMKLVELEQQIAQGEKDAKRKLELEQQIAQDKKDAKMKLVEMDQEKAKVKKEAKRKRTELEQRIAQEKKAASRKLGETELQMAWERRGKIGGDHGGPEGT